MDGASVATKRMLEDEIGGETALANISPRNDQDGVTKAIQSALNDLLWQLEQRVPPVHESDLADITQLTVPVVYGALANLFGQNVAIGGDKEDVNAFQSRRYQQKYNTYARDLKPKVGGSSQIAAPRGITLHRR